MPRNLTINARSSHADGVGGVEGFDGGSAAAIDRFGNVARSDGPAAAPRIGGHRADQRWQAVPGMIDEYVKMCDTVFAGVGVRFSAEELAHLKTVLEGQLAEAYEASPRSRIVISYDSPVGTDAELPRQSRMVDDRGRLRQLGRHPRAATVRHRTGRASVGAGRRNRRSKHPSGARHRRRDRA